MTTIKHKNLINKTQRSKGRCEAQNYCLNPVLQQVCSTSTQVSFLSLSNIFFYKLQHQIRFQNPCLHCCCHWENANKRVWLRLMELQFWLVQPLANKTLAHIQHHTKSARLQSFGEEYTANQTLRKWGSPQAWKQSKGQAILGGMT